MKDINAYKRTKLACYLGFVTQAIVANFTPLLFLAFHREYDIPIASLALMPAARWALPWWAFVPVPAKTASRAACWRLRSSRCCWYSVFC